MEYGVEGTLMVQLGLTWWLPFSKGKCSKSMANGPTVASEIEAEAFPVDPSVTWQGN